MVRNLLLESCGSISDQKLERLRKIKEGYLLLMIPPIAYEPVRKDVLFCDVATRKVKRQSSISKNQMFRSMIAQAIANKIKFEYIYFHFKELPFE
jgi:hypothetical protein